MKLIELTEDEAEHLKEYLQDIVDDDWTHENLVNILGKLGGDLSKAQVVTDDDF